MTTALENVDVRTTSGTDVQMVHIVDLGELAETGLVVDEGERECLVFFEVVSDEDSRASLFKDALEECGHFACDACMFGHVRVRVMDEGDLSLLVCPAEACRVRISARAAERILAPDEAAVVRFWHLKSSVIVARSDTVSGVHQQGVQHQ